MTGTRRRGQAAASPSNGRSRQGIAALALSALVLGAGPACAADYVGLGSSYAAGPGVGTRDQASKSCLRSQSNYAHLLAAKRNLTLDDVSCSGATTKDILTNSQDGFPPQIQAVTAATKLVTVTIGGNDVDYIGNLLALSCQDQPAIAGSAQRSCGVKTPDEVEALFEALPDSLAAVATAVHQRAPAARLVFIDYLPVLPGPIGCPDKVPLTNADAFRVRMTLDRLDTDIKRVAAQTGSLFVPSGAIGTGHGACSDVPFVADYKPPVTPGWPYAIAYHPTQAGMAALA